MIPAFVKRNLTLFFRDRAAVMSSLLAVFIVIVLYALFLGDVWLDGSMDYVENASHLMDAWLMAGLLSIASITTTMGAFGIMVEDKAKRIDKDFYSSPMRRRSITVGYLGSAFLIGTIMSCITLILAQIYIVMRGGAWFSPVTCIESFLLILLSVLVSTSLVCFIVSFLKSQNAFGTASAILGTLVGFLTGVYLPVGALPGFAQTLIGAFPLTHSTSLLRQILMEESMGEGFEGSPTESLDEFKEYMGIDVHIGGFEVAPTISVLILILTTLVFFGLSVLNMSRKND